MIFNKFKPKKLNNSGSSLVTAIIAVTFISIIATMLLYVAGTNYITKMTDRRNKEIFYQAETALEEVKKGLVLVASDASDEAYIDTMVSYTVDNSYTRYSIYQEKFFEEFEKAFNAKYNAAPGANPDEKLSNVLRDMVEGTYATSIEAKAARAGDGSYIVEGGQTITLDKSRIGDGYLFVRDVQIVYIKENYTSVIKTDFVITAPEMNWSVSSSYVRPDDDPDPLGEKHGTEKADERRMYDIAEYVNYYNWTRN